MSSLIIKQEDREVCFRFEYIDYIEWVSEATQGDWGGKVALRVFLSKRRDPYAILVSKEIAEEIIKDFDSRLSKMNKTNSDT